MKYIYDVRTRKWKRNKQKKSDFPFFCTNKVGMYVKMEKGKKDNDDEEKAPLLKEQ